MHNTCTFPEAKPISNPIDTVKVESKSDSIMEIFEPFISDGFVSLSSNFCNATSVRILRDTGASQSLLLADTLPFDDNSTSGRSVLIKGVDSSSYTAVPLHNVFLSSDIVSGPVTLGIKSSLPFEGVQLLLGNDLAGDKVQSNPIVTEKPYFGQVPDSAEQEFPELYPACAVTRAMKKKFDETQDAHESHTQSDKIVDLADTFMSQLSDVCDETHNSLQCSDILPGQGYDPSRSKFSI